MEEGEDDDEDGDSSQQESLFVLQTMEIFVQACKLAVKVRKVPSKQALELAVMLGDVLSTHVHLVSLLRKSEKVGFQPRKAKLRSKELISEFKRLAEADDSVSLTLEQRCLLVHTMEGKVGAFSFMVFHECFLHSPQVTPFWSCAVMLFEQGEIPYWKLPSCLNEAARSGYFILTGVHEDLCFCAEDRRQRMTVMEVKVASHAWNVDDDFAGRFKCSSSISTGDPGATIMEVEVEGLVHGHGPRDHARKMYGPAVHMERSVFENQNTFHVFIERDMFEKALERDICPLEERNEDDEDEDYVFTQSVIDFLSVHYVSLAFEIDDFPCKLVVEKVFNGQVKKRDIILVLSMVNNHGLVAVQFKGRVFVKWLFKKDGCGLSKLISENFINLEWKQSSVAVKSYVATSKLRHAIFVLNYDSSRGMGATNVMGETSPQEGAVSSSVSRWDAGKSFFEAHVYASLVEAGSFMMFFTFMDDCNEVNHVLSFFSHDLLFVNVWERNGFCLLCNCFEVLRGILMERQHGELLEMENYHKVKQDSCFLDISFGMLTPFLNRDVSKGALLLKFMHVHGSSLSQKDFAVKRERVSSHVLFFHAAIVAAPGKAAGKKDGADEVQATERRAKPPAADGLVLQRMEFPSKTQGHYCLLMLLISNGQLVFNPMVNIQRFWSFLTQSSRHSPQALGCREEFYNRTHWQLISRCWEPPTEMLLIWTKEITCEPLVVVQKFKFPLSGFQHAHAKKASTFPFTEMHKDLCLFWEKRQGQNLFSKRDKCFDEKGDRFSSLSRFHLNSGGKDYFVFNQGLTSQKGSSMTHGPFLGLYFRASSAKKEDNVFAMSITLGICFMLRRTDVPFVFCYVVVLRRSY